MLPVLSDRNMPLSLSKDCFPAPTKCHNCERKFSNYVKKRSEPKEDYKRCGNCHMMTYCDKDCQREHWLKVHKKHCRFLSGKALVKNSKHNPAVCSRCIEQKQASLAQLRSKNSPKTVCNMEQDAVTMKRALSDAFQFHATGKKCNCSLQYACELPFPLDGEVSVQYVEMGNTGLDVLMTNALNILYAMVTKANQNEDRKNALSQLWNDILQERAFQWCDILVEGVQCYHSIKYLTDQVDALKASYGASDAWWKVLKFSVDFIVKTNLNISSNFHESRSLEGPRFEHLKQVHDSQQSQLRNQAIVCEKKLWPVFIFWPALVNGSLAMLLPPETRCQSCSAELSGQVAISNQEVNYRALPNLLADVGDNGALMASCSVNKNPNCLRDCLNKNVTHRIKADKVQNKEFVKELDLFNNESIGCDFCMKWNLSSHRCSSCLAVQYCSTVCLKKDLEFHKTVCSTWAKDKSRRIVDRGKQRNYWKSVNEEQ